jgi:hypothetical protein
MTTLVEIMSGVLRFFPNTMIVTLLLVGTLTGKLSWIFVSLGGILLAALILILQTVMGRAFAVGSVSEGGIPGGAIMEACSLIPIARGAEYSATPSLWMALSAFFATYIFINAVNVYTAAPANKPNDALPVQQRKGVGMISMLATVLLFVFLMIPRFRTPCETLGGTLFGVSAGITFAWAWWKILDACGSDVVPDIHGVMLGLKPGTLHSAPVACTPV